ncbi:MAG: hypothetical protein HZA84_01145 [Thaumarchaeota archaeon]|nr:hypothetical protein [Nitrososphaerota archaeon]
MIESRTTNVQASRNVGKLTRGNRRGHDTNETIGGVTIEVCGNDQNVTPSPYFEDQKAFFTRSAFGSPDLSISEQALSIVNRSSAQLDATNMLPTNVQVNECGLIQEAKV